MRTFLVALSLAILAPAATRAQEERPASRFTLGLRAGLAFPAGSSYADASTGHAFALSDGVRLQVPFQLEGAYRLSDRIAVGAYASYGFGSVGRTVKASCDAARTSCSASTVRAGVQGSYALQPVREGVTPWLGLGLGWEWTSDSSGALTETFSGPELASLQGGIDWRSGRNLSVGFYVQLALGRFWRLEQSAPRPIGSTTFDLDARFHAWLGAGVRGTVRL